MILSREYKKQLSIKILTIYIVLFDMYIHMMYIKQVKFDWDSKENEWLKEVRKISFEKIIYHLSQGDIWKITDHPDQDNYPGQNIYFVIVDDYIYLVPHISGSNYIFLKTIIPSRKATSLYKKSKEINNEI